MNNTVKTVSICVVALNEEGYLPNLLQDIKNQTYPHNLIEVVFVDSGSTDSTKEIMENFKNENNDFLGVQILDNPKKILPCGCNVALKNYTGDAIVRIDAHANIPKDFLEKNVELLNSGEMVCGGARPNVIDGSTPFKKTLLIAEQSMFGSSIASYRHSNKTSYVSSIFHGMYRREVYDAVGLYDERLGRTEDNDMSYRIREKGFKIAYNPSIISYQHTRSSLKKMLKQKYGNGYWIGKTMGINPKCFSVFHFVPFLFVLGIIFTTLLAVFGLPFLSYLMWGAYLLFILATSILEIVKNPFSITNFALPVIFFLLHTSYGIGTLIGLIKMPFWVKKIKTYEVK